MEPTWQSDDGAVRLYLGDCLDVLPTLPSGSVDAVIADPPYGGNYNTDYTRFTGCLADNRNHGEGIIGDDKPFDPSPFAFARHRVFWGYQHFSAALPIGTILYWGKKRDNQLGTFLSDGELAWCSHGMGVYEFRHVWHGFDRESERGQVLHPTQKPVALMKWCMEVCGVPPIATVFDPYMGSGPIAEACVITGRKYIGCELDPTHFETAKRRIIAAIEAERTNMFREQIQAERQEAKQTNLFETT